MQNSLTIRRGYFPLLGFCLALSMMILPGCQYLPKRGAIADQAYVFKDGTEAAAGDTIYVNAAGDATAAPTDADGKPHEELPEYDIEKIEDYADKGKAVASNLPFPFNLLGGGLLAAGSLTGLMLLRRRNRKQIEDLGGKPKKKTY